MNQSELFILIFGQSQAAFLRANEYQLSDCAKYFLEHVTRLGQHGYIPTTQDILHTRVRTSGIVEVKFHIKVTIAKIMAIKGARQRVINLTPKS